MPPKQGINKGVWGRLNSLPSKDSREDSKNVYNIFREGLKKES